MVTGDLSVLVIVPAEEDWPACNDVKTFCVRRLALVTAVIAVRSSFWRIVIVEVEVEKIAQTDQR